MLKGIKCCLLAFALVLTASQSARAQYVYVWPMDNGGKSIEISLDRHGENGVWITVSTDRIDIRLNREFYTVPINGDVNNRMRIIDGDYDSAILIGGTTPPAGLNIWIWGQGGNDWIHNQIGHPNGFWGSTIYGGDGDDEIWSGAGPDTVYGGNGDDVIYGGTGVDWIEGQAGNDLLFGDDGNDNLLGGDGYDEVDGGAGDDGLYGNKRLPDRDGTSDLLIGGPGSDRFYSAFYRWAVSGQYRSKSYAEQEVMDDFNPYADTNIETEIPRTYYRAK